MCAQVVASVVDAEIKASHVLSDCVSYIWAATDDEALGLHVVRNGSILIAI